MHAEGAASLFFCRMEEEGSEALCFHLLWGALAWPKQPLARSAFSLTSPRSELLLRALREPAQVLSISSKLRTDRLRAHTDHEPP